MIIYDECIHVNYSEQAGGWIVCDDCGKDITLDRLEDDEPEAGIGDHKWVRRGEQKWDVCARCGVVRQALGNKPCSGVMPRIRL